jgi:hypothetical protein
MRCFEFSPRCVPCHDHVRLIVNMATGSKFFWVGSGRALQSWKLAGAINFDCAAFAFCSSFSATAELFAADLIGISIS